MALRARGRAKPEKREPRHKPTNDRANSAVIDAQPLRIITFFAMTP
jgi:hypothetical protein